MRYDKGISWIVTSCVVPGCEEEAQHPFNEDYPKHHRKRDLWDAGWGQSQGVWHCPKHNPSYYARKKKAEQAEGARP